MARTTKPVGTHWCGGRLFKDGNNAVRCADCDRIKIISSEERDGLRRQLNVRTEARNIAAEERRRVYFK